MAWLGMGRAISEEQRATVLRELERSGLSVAEFCRRHGCAYGTVVRWRRAARKRADQGEARGRFVELEWAENDAGEPMVQSMENPKGAVAMLCAELALPDGVVLRVYRNSVKGGEA